MSVPLTTSDERGLSHLGLDSRLRRTFIELPRGKLAQLCNQVYALSQ